MANLTIALGAEADVASGAELKNEGSSIVERITRAPTRPRAGTWARRAASGVMPASGPLTLTLGSPGVATYWDVRQLTVLGADDRTNVTGSSVAFYIGQQTADGSAMSLADCLLPATQGGAAASIPNVASFSSDTCVVYPHERALLLIYGAAAATPLVAVIRFWLRPLDGAMTGQA